MGVAGLVAAAVAAAVVVGAVAEEAAVEDDAGRPMTATGRVARRSALQIWYRAPWDWRLVMLTAGWLSYGVVCHEHGTVLT